MENIILEKIKGDIALECGYESFNQLLKDHCMNNSSIIADALNNIIKDIAVRCFKYSSMNNKTILKDYPSLTGVVGMKESDISALKLNTSSSPVELILKVDTQLIEEFLKGLSFGIKLKK